ncbi:MAG: TetR/AcrR family transcriptional regulator, partial [Clostridiales bacterium]|nr:TetR/AcrR family transcriptional regulator [Clostridiales bacterium]
GMKVSTIAKKADVGKGTVYEYFCSKEDMFLGAVEYGVGLLGNMVSEKLEGSETFIERFNILVDCIIDVAKNGPFMSFMSDAPNMPFSPDTINKLKDILGEAMQNFIEILSDILEMGAQEGLIKSSPTLYQKKAMLIIISNMTMQSIHSGDDDIAELKDFYYVTCLKLLA